MSDHDTLSSTSKSSPVTPASLKVFANASLGEERNSSPSQSTRGPRSIVCEVPKDLPPSFEQVDPSEFGFASSTSGYPKLVNFFQPTGTERRLRRNAAGRSGGIFEVEPSGGYRYVERFDSEIDQSFDPSLPFA